MLSAAYTWSLNAIAALWRGVQIYGMRLYAGEPALILRAQGQLLLWTARCLTGSLRPTAVSMLAPGESATVTGQFSSADRGLLAATLEGRGSRAEACAPGHRGIAAIAKAVECGDGLLYFSATRWYGLPSINVSCPTARLDVLGFGIGWFVWLSLVGLLAMLVFRRQFGVVL